MATSTGHPGRASSSASLRGTEVREPRATGASRRKRRARLARAVLHRRRLGALRADTAVGRRHGVPRRRRGPHRGRRPRPVVHADARLARARASSTRGDRAGRTGHRRGAPSSTCPPVGRPPPTRGAARAAACSSSWRCSLAARPGCASGGGDAGGAPRRRPASRTPGPSCATRRATSACRGRTPDTPRQAAAGVIATPAPGRGRRPTAPPGSAGRSSSARYAPTPPVDRRRAETSRRCAAALLAPGGPCGAGPGDAAHRLAAHRASCR